MSEVTGLAPRNKMNNGSKKFRTKLTYIHEASYFCKETQIQKRKEFEKKKKFKERLPNAWHGANNNQVIYFARRSQWRKTLAHRAQQSKIVVLEVYKTLVKKWRLIYHDQSKLMCHLAGQREGLRTPCSSRVVPCISKSNDKTSHLLVVTLI